MLSATFRQLQTFALVVELESFAKAGDRLGVSPAAISEQIRALERNLRYQVFTRRPGMSPVLNADGTALVQQLPALLAGAQEIAKRSRQTAVAPLKARLGAGEYILEHILVPNAAGFQERHPDVSIEFVSLASIQHAARETAAGRIDLAYAAAPGDVRPEGAEFIGTSTLCLAANPKHPVVRQWTRCRPARLPMIMPPEGSENDRALVRMLVLEGLGEIDVVIRVLRHSAMIALAVEGLGVACVFREQIARELKQGTLVELETGLGTLHRWALRRPGALDLEHLRQVDRFFVELLRQASNDWPASRGPKLHIDKMQRKPIDPTNP